MHLNNLIAKAKKSADPLINAHASIALLQEVLWCYVTS